MQRHCLAHYHNSIPLHCFEPILGAPPWTWRIDAFKLWCWRRLLRVPWIARRSNQSILKEINIEYSLEGLMMKLKLQCFGHLMWRANSLEKDSDAGKEQRQEEKRMTGQDGWMASRTQWTWVWASSGRRWRTGKPGVLQSMGLQRVGATAQQPPWSWPLSGMPQNPPPFRDSRVNALYSREVLEVKILQLQPCRLRCLVGVTEENDILWGTPGPSGKCQLRNVSPLRTAFCTGIPDLWLPRTFSLDLSFLVLFQLWSHSDLISECAHLDAQLSSFVLWPLESHICIWSSALRADWLLPLQTHLSLQDRLPPVTFRGHHPQTPALTQ